MAIFTVDRLRNRIRTELSKKHSRYANDTMQGAVHKILNESYNKQNSVFAQNREYDIFLSHSSSDAAVVAGLKLELEDMQYSVYVDWIDDPQMNRSKVNKETARILKQRMQNSKSLFYAFTESATESKWMPWELGYFDGIKEKAAVLPISVDSKMEFKGTEYLGMYYYITKEKNKLFNIDFLYVNETALKYCTYEEWIEGINEPCTH